VITRSYRVVSTRCRIGWRASVSEEEKHGADGTPFGLEMQGPRYWRPTLAWVTRVAEAHVQRRVRRHQREAKSIERTYPG
jgi:hypothetical protein